MKKVVKKQIKKNNMEPRQYSLVKAVEDNGKLKKSEIYIFFGEIPNVPGHYVVSDFKSGKVIAGYHLENFIEIPDDET